MLEAILESTLWDGRCQGAHNFRRRHAVGVTADSIFDSRECFLGDMIRQSGLSCA
jgi:hypothetical protein